MARRAEIRTDRADTDNLQYVDGKGTLHERTYSQGYEKTTNNRMELMAAIVGLEALNRRVRWSCIRILSI